MLRSDWKAKAKASWTVRINAVATLLMGWMWFDPTSVLAVWNMMPLAVRPAIPQNIVTIVGMVLFVLSMLVRLRPKPGGQ